MPEERSTPALVFGAASSAAFSAARSTVRRLASVWSMAVSIRRRTTGSSFMFGAPLRERAQFPGVCLSLCRDHPLQDGSEAGGCGELEEEVVAVSGLADERRFKPGVELGATGVLLRR